MEERLQQTAIHEAGHAVAHARFGIDHAGANIVPDGNGLLGAAIGEGVNHVWNASKAAPMVIAYCAGYGATIAAGYSEDDSCAGADDDFDHACELIEFWGLPGSIEAWKAQAVEFMRRPENLSAVALVARHLLERKRLDGDYVDVLMEVANGDTTEAEFAQYLSNRGDIERWL